MLKCKRRFTAVLVVLFLVITGILSGCSRKPSPSSSAASRAVESVTTSSAATSAASSSATSPPASSVASQSHLPSIEEVTPTIQKYYRTAGLLPQESFALFGELGLSSLPGDIANGVSSNKKGSNEVAYEEYKTAMLQYVSERLFESKYMANYKVKNGELMQCGMGDGSAETVHNVTYMGESDGEYRFKVKISNRGKGSSVIIFSMQQVTMIQSGGHYVVDRSVQLEEAVQGPQWGLRFFDQTFPNIKFDEGTYTVSGIPVGTDIQKLNDTLVETSGERFELYQNGKQIVKGDIAAGMKIRFYKYDGEFAEYTVAELLS